MALRLGQAPSEASPWGFGQSLKTTRSPFHTSLPTLNIFPALSIVLSALHKGIKQEKQITLKRKKYNKSKYLHSLIQHSSGVKSHKQIILSFTKSSKFVQLS